MGQHVKCQIKQWNHRIGRFKTEQDIGNAGGKTPIRWNKTNIQTSELKSKKKIK